VYRGENRRENIVYRGENTRENMFSENLRGGVPSGEQEENKFSENLAR
jgi:hypothetical protein